MDATQSYRAKIKTVYEIANEIGPRPRAQKVVMCHGTFDIVHPGHLRHLMFAKERGDILIASITADKHITKANYRPHVPESLRAENLAAFEMVDYVLIDYAETPLENLEILKPDYFAKGYEYSTDGVNQKTKAEIAVLETWGGEILFTPGDVIYSSSALIEMSPPNISKEILHTVMSAHGIKFADLYAALNAMAGITVHVVGDTIVDTITNTLMIGGYTKTPTPSVQVQNHIDYVGGAAIVAKHLRAAGAKVFFSTVLGNDRHGKFIVDDLSSAGITMMHEVDMTRPTTNKDAIVASGYRMIKIDRVDNRSISPKTFARLTENVSELKTDVVCFCDFRHGIFNHETIPAFTVSIPDGCFRVADSQVASRWGNILEFLDFDLITPNEREARFALGDQDSVIRPLASRLYEAARCKTLILKLGERGILTHSGPLESNRAFYAIPSFSERVVDAVGAGDALLAYATLAQKATGSDLIASILGSFAAAVECECNGNIPVNPNAVRDKIEQVELLTPPDF